MAIERTFSIIKPDATARNLTGAINAMIEQAGLRIVAQKRIRITRAQAETFYAVHRERPFFGELVDFMISGPVVVQVLEGENAIAKYRDIMGATDPAKAAAGHHPQGPRQVDRRELGARLGRTAIRRSRRSPSSSPATRSSAKDLAPSHPCTDAALRAARRACRPGWHAEGAAAALRHLRVVWSRSPAGQARRRGYRLGGARAARGGRGAGGASREHQHRLNASAVETARPRKGIEVGFLLDDIMHAPFWIAVVQIIGVNIILSGDNAVVIALACMTLAAAAAALGHDPGRRRGGAAARAVHPGRRAGDDLPLSSSWSAACCCSGSRSSSCSGGCRRRGRGRVGGQPLARGAYRRHRRHRDEPRQRDRDRGLGGYRRRARRPCACRGHQDHADQSSAWLPASR